MKKRLGEFTLDELADLCGQTNCDECPFRDSDVLCDFLNALGKNSCVYAEGDTEGDLTQLNSII